MIEIVVPCMVEHSNLIELVSVGSCNLQWSPNWSNIFDNNKVLIYDIISDNSLNDSEVLINVGHTTIKLNDLKFLFKLNGIHSNCKLYYDAAVLNKLIKFSIPANMLIAIINYCEENQIPGLFVKVNDDQYNASCIIERIAPNGGINHEEIVKFFKNFLSLSIRDEIKYSIQFNNDAHTEAIEAHLNYNLNLSKQANKVREASALLCNKLIDLLQLDRKSYERVAGSPIPNGNMSYSPNRPNFLRSTCFSMKGVTENKAIDGYTSGVLYYKCMTPITSSFFLYNKENNIYISNATIAFRPEVYGSKDPALFNNIDDNMKVEMKKQKIFNEIALNLDLLNKALKAFVAGDLLYFYAITGIIFIITNNLSNGLLIIHDLDEKLIKTISSYDNLSIALGGIRSDDNDIVVS